MDPLSAALGIAGLGMQIFGTVKGAGAAKKNAQLSQQVSQISQDTARTEMQQDAVRRQAMELNAHRQQLETIRNAQRARALSLTAATSQGSQFGSVLAGAYGGESGTEGTGLLGISNQLQFGRNMFDLNAHISQNRIATAGIQGQQALIQGQAATDQGIASLGSSLMKSGPTIGNIAGAAGSFGSNAYNFFNKPGITALS